MLIPRIIISGLSGGAGKTMVSLGLARALARDGLRVKAFKKGPDYIDAAWLALAAGSSQSNLDPFFTPADGLRSLFCKGAAEHDFALIEGNRGIFDGLDLSGSCSTAELSRILSTPIVLVVDCTKMTRTAAALVAGCVNFEPGVRIGGVILNRTGSSRHQALVRSAVEDLAGVPVLGVLPRRAAPFITERHMGLAGTNENSDAVAHLDGLADFMAEHVDMARVRALAKSAPPLPMNAVSAAAPVEISTAPECRPPAPAEAAATEPARSPRPRIGYVRDAAFWFYYQENLTALQEAGAELIELSLLNTALWPLIDGLYLGGGLPELYAQELSGNLTRRNEVAALSRAGLPIYAECGGFMYLARDIIVDGVAYPMAGVFPCSVEFCQRPQGLGYIEAEVVAANPYHPLGATFRGHEFHFSRCVPEQVDTAPAPGQSESHILRLSKGRGMATVPTLGNCDGLLVANTFAAYAHIYAPALPHWAPAFVALCRQVSS